MTRKEQYDALKMSLKLVFFCAKIGKEDEAIDLAFHISALLTVEEVEKARDEVAKELGLGGEHPHH